MTSALSIDDNVSSDLDAAVEAGGAIYDWVLPLYDFVVMRFNSPVLWRCSPRTLQDHYARHVSTRHLDVGVGSGYFLDRCSFGTEQPQLGLCDLNARALRYVRRRLARFDDVALYRRNVLEPLELPRRYHSVGLNYVLHCIPGAMQDKGIRVLGNLAACLEPGGVLFGATVLADKAQQWKLSRVALRRICARGIFHNQRDTEAGLRQALESVFSQHEIRVEGAVALFWGRNG